MICLKNVIFGYDDTKIIDEFSYCFNDNGFYGIRGTSGSGKTTLLNIIGGIIKPQKGEVLYSEDIKECSNYISFIFQDNNLFEKLTVLENINILGLTDGKKTDKDVDLILERLYVRKYKNTLVSDLSGGERQRIAIAIALIRGAKVIIADEPCASLDDYTAREMMHIFKDLSKDHLIIISSHNQVMLNSYCNNIIDFPLVSLEYDISDNMCNGVDFGISLSINNFYKIHKNITSYKGGLKFIITCLLIVLIGSCAYMLGIYNYSIDKFAVSMINENQTEDIFVSGDINNLTEDYFNECISGFDGEIYISQFTDKTNVYNPYLTDEPIEKIVIDDNLNENEIIVTDFTLYYLSCYEIVDISNFSQSKGKILSIKDRFGYDHNLTIVDVIKTPIIDNILLNMELDYELRSCMSKQLFTYAIINKKTWFNIFESNMDAGLFDFFNAVNGVNCRCLPQDDLFGNDIKISEKMLGIISSQTNRNYNVGDNIEITFSTLRNVDITKNMKIAEIDDSVNSLCLYYSLDIMDLEVKFQLSKYDTYVNELYVKTSDVDNLSTLVKKIYNNDKLNISYYGNTLVKSTYGGIEAFKKISSSIILVVSFISVFFIVFFVISSFKANDRNYKILMIYGIKKRYILLLTLINFLLVLVVSIVFGSIFAYYGGKYIDNLISSGMDSSLFSTYNFIYSVISSFFVILVTFVVALVGYIIVSTKKKRSHIAI